MPLLKYWYKYTNNRKYRKIKESEKDKLNIRLYKEKYSEVLDTIQRKKVLNTNLSFKHSGHLGDIVYSLPVIKELSKTHTCNLYIAENKPVKNYYRHPAGNVMLNSKLTTKLLPLLQKQDYIAKVSVWHDEEIDIDLDLFRELPINFSFLSHRWFFHIAGVQPDLNMPYLFADSHPVIKDKIVLVRSFRAQNDLIDYSFLADYNNLLFIGLQEEYEDMQKLIPNLEFYDVKDFYEMAQIIKACRFFIGNQSFAYAIADGLKVPRLLEAYPKFPVVQPLGQNSYDFYFQQHFEYYFNKLYTM